MTTNRIPFSKMSGLGNDFIAIDNRDGKIEGKSYRNLAKRLCRRRLDIGADGILVLEDNPDYDFRMRYLNPDGSEAMCGNGARCIVRFAHSLGVIGDETVFLGDDGPHRAWVLDDGIRLELGEPKDIRLNLEVDFDDCGKWTLHYVEVGVPHVVAFSAGLENLALIRIGRRIRQHKFFMPQGTNANFVVVNGRNDICIRTYERGVEDETLACGTGSTASAIIGSILGLTEPPVRVKTWSGGQLTIDFEQDDDEIRDVFLTGDAVEVFQGGISL